MQFLKKPFFIATILATLAVAASGLAQTASVTSNLTTPDLKPAFTGKFFQLPKTSPQSVSNSITISTESSSSARTQTFSLHLPSDANTRSLKVTLNGHDVSGRFVGSRGFLGAEDGLTSFKNVLSVTVKTASGGMASGRWRSMSGPVAKINESSKMTRLIVTQTAGANTPAVVKAVTEAAPACDPVAMCPAWLPPSVRFDTLTPGGWTLGSTPWISVNGVGYGYYSGTVGSPHYALAAFDRQTLQLMDWEWFADGSTFTSWLKKYPSTYLVIAGTTGLPSDVLAGDVDTSSIGGTNFANWKGSFPNSYMVIGSPGQAPGTAYENRRSADAFATGSLLEDANGNYNFQSTDIIEYAIEPQDPTYYGNPTIEMNVPQNLRVHGETRLELIANATAGQNGLWLLVLDRSNPMPQASENTSGCYDAGLTNGVRAMQNCGTFYAVGPGNSNIDGEWSALAAALTTVSGNQIVFLQSIGSVGSGSLAQTITSGTAFGGFQQFVPAFEAVGGTPMAVAGPTFTNQDNYAFVGYLGAANALSGDAAEASSALPGQSGVLHGTLQRDQNGLYRPAQASAEQQGMFTAKGGLSDSDFTLSIASYQQPVDWPSNSGTALLSSASSIAGQQAAYRFISHWLLANYYMKTIQGPHQDDLHFFFAGSTNTSINYQAMDPVNLLLPTVGTWNTFGCTTFDGTTCTFQATGDSAASSFTVSDFNAEKAQISLEVIYLTNTLQYLVTGSTNLKDVVASGNANVGLALTAAASTVEGSGMANLNSQEIASKQVSFSWQALLGTLGGIAETAANIEAFGELTPAWDALSEAAQVLTKRISSGANAVGALVSTIGSGGGIATSTSTLSSSPQPFVKLTTTVGELATQDLQSPLLVGFDTTADNLTSDWGRLSSIGPRTTNTDDSTFFAPNQVTQLAAINGLTSASSRTFYFSLLPTVYNLHYWTGVGWVGAASGVFQPSVGSLESHAEGDSCNAFYLTPNNNVYHALGTLSLNQGMTYPSVGNTSHPFGQDEDFTDFWVMDGVVSKSGSQSTNITVIDADLAANLFTANQLNVPMLQMFSANGPMSSVTKDASVDRLSGWSNINVCDASDPNYDLSNVVVGAPSDGRLLTTTTLISPMSGVLGHDALFTAQVVSSSKPVTSGLVYISVDGTVVGSPTVGTSGTASWTVQGGLALGNHTIQADYAPGTGYEGSSATPATFVVYSESPDISLTVPSTTMSVSYTASSSAAAVQLGSIAGLAGNVVLSCTGLPAGLTCSFNPQSLTLAANGSVTASVQIGPGTTAQAVPGMSLLAKTSLAILTLPVLGMGFLRKGHLVTKLATLVILAAGVTSLALTGCSGGSATPSVTREVGLKTITVNASVGSVSRSAALNINIQ
jgi:hypothetical protein